MNRLDFPESQRDALVRNFAAARRNFLRLALVGSLVAARVLCAAPAPSDILVVADLTPAGKAAPQASPDSPIHYEPMWVGFRELGAVVAGEKEPPLEAAKKSLTEALRRAGYLPAGPDTPPPTVVIFFAWGTLNPDTVTTPGSGVEGQDETVSFNSAQMLGFLGAHKVARLSDHAPARELVVSAAREDQYFLAVAAYDRASLYERKRKLLWMTRIATDALRVWLPNVLPAMVASGTPYFGKGADLPVWVDPGAHLKAEVQVGPITVEGYQADGNTPEPGRKSEDRKP